MKTPQTETPRRYAPVRLPDRQAVHAGRLYSHAELAGEHRYAAECGAGRYPVDRYLAGQVYTTMVRRSAAAADGEPVTCRNCRRNYPDSVALAQRPDQPAPCRCTDDPDRKADVVECGSCGHRWCDRCEPTHGPRCPREATAWHGFTESGAI